MISIAKLADDTSRAISKFESYAASFREPQSGEAGFHWPRAMEFGLATFGGVA